MKEPLQHMSQEIIGYTTGVYDMFHIGHLNLLLRAKSECDHLIVGVTTDELVMQRKHKQPVIPFAERKAIIEALRCVDEVVEQASMDKLAAYKRLRFDKMFVGSDWQGTPAWQQFEEELRPYGVQIVYLPHTDGVSSTLLSEKLSTGEMPVQEERP